MKIERGAAIPLAGPDRSPLEDVRGLVVDRSQQSLLSLASVCRQLGVELDCAQTLEEAKEVFAARAGSGSPHQFVFADEETVEGDVRRLSASLRQVAKGADFSVVGIGRRGQGMNKGESAWLTFPIRERRLM